MQLEKPVEKTPGVHVTFAVKGTESKTITVYKTTVAELLGRVRGMILANGKKHK